MSSEEKLSVVIITFNESHNIEDCIESVREVADEILIVDSFSSDDTISKAEALGARVIPHTFEGHIEQKNWAKDQASFKFVLSIDADERLSQELIGSILREKQKGFHHSGYYMNRLNFIGKHPIKGCGWYPDKKLRLWNRHLGKWAGINPHDKFRLQHGYPKMKLSGDLWHYSYANRSELFKKSINYGKIGAKYAKTLPFLILLGKMTFSPLFKFLRNYFLKGGIIYGLNGLVICVCQLIEGYIKYFRGFGLKARIIRS